MSDGIEKGKAAMDAKVDLLHDGAVGRCRK
jgi:hypothetical protein